VLVHALTIRCGRVIRRRRLPLVSSGYGRSLFTVRPEVGAGHACTQQRRRRRQQCGEHDRTERQPPSPSPVRQRLRHPSGHALDLP